MYLKRFACVCLALLMTITLLPTQALAQGTGQGSFTGQVRTAMTDLLAVSSAGEGPTLAEGNHERWIDRIADPPQYALDFYTWLEENRDGALIDPTMEITVDGAYVHLVHTLKSSAPFTYSGTGHKAAAEQALLADLGEDHLTVANYAGAVYGAFDRDHPEVFWLSGKAVYAYAVGYDYSYGSGRGTVKYEVDIYFYLKSSDFDLRNTNFQNTDTIRAGVTEREQLIASCVDAAPTTGPYDQLAYFNRVLTETNCYNSAVAQGDQSGASPDAWEAISALRGKTGTEGPVCEGYARAYMLLCQAAGIPCVLVEGPAKATASGESIGHMWNYVQLDGSWYAVDTTWNDPYTTAKPTTARSGLENDRWFLLGSDTQMSDHMTFIQSHTVTNRTTVNGLDYVNGPILASEAYEPAAPLTVPTLTLKYPTVSFEDVIIMNVYYAAENIQDVAEMGLITFAEKPEAADIALAETVIAGYTPDSELYISSTEGIAPKDLGDDIHFAVYAKLTDGTYAYSKVASYSPKTYAVNQLTTGAAQMRPLVAAMLNYGAAAQTYFKYNMDNLVNADMTEDQKALAEAYSDTMITPVTQPSGDKVSNFVNDKTYSGRYPTISFEGAFCINYYFRPSLAVEGDVTMYVWSAEDYSKASVLTKANATDVVKMTATASGEYLGVVDGIAAKDLDKVVYVSFVYSDGTTEHCGGVVAYSIGAYCKSQAATTGTLSDLAKACAVYGYYAKQLFG